MDGKGDGRSKFQLSDTGQSKLYYFNASWANWFILNPWKELNDAIRLDQKSTLIDVRSKTEFGICHLPGSTS